MTRRPPESTRPHPLLPYAPRVRSSMSAHNTYAAGCKVDGPTVLIGLLGSGKSSLGRRLAVRLGLPFFDADHEIEAAAGRTISEIFEKFGEAHFRDGERREIGRAHV